MYALSVHAVSFADGEDLEVGETMAPMQRIGVARKQECASASRCSMPPTPMTPMMFHDFHATE